MIDFVIYIIILCIVFGLLHYVVTLIPLPDPFKRIAVIAVLLIFILVVLGAIFGGIPMPRLVLPR